MFKNVIFCVAFFKQIVYNYKNPKGDYMNMIEKRIKDIGVFNVARELNVTPQRVSNWIRRKSYPIPYIRPLSKILKIRVEDFLRELETEYIK